MLAAITPSQPVHALIATRRSPYQFSGEAVPAETLRSLFEAARWSPSCYNEQPWAYIVARCEDGEAFARLLSCLVEPNQVWAKEAPVLALGLAHTAFTRNGNPNVHAPHDLGAASAYLTVEATARGLYVHQMGGILPDRARELYHVPVDWQILTGIAIGKLGNPADLPDAYRQRDTNTPSRKPLTDFVFTDDFARTSPFLA